MYAREQAIIATPIGIVRIVGSENRWISLSIGDDQQLIPPRSLLLTRAAVQLAEWFAGTRQHFDLPLMPIDSDRGRVLRDGLIAIPFGQTTSYGALSKALHSSPRAIGQACARNTLPIIVPCHRVVSTGGALGAYSAGDGPATKAWLLAHEQRYAGTIDGHLPM